MRTPTEHIKTLQRRVDFLKTRAHKNSFDAAEIGSLEWAIVNLQTQKPWFGLTEEEVIDCWPGLVMHMNSAEFWKNIEDKLKEKNT